MGGDEYCKFELVKKLSRYLLVSVFVILSSIGSPFQTSLDTLIVCRLLFVTG
jgi:hypothetical protein